jgi:hypothetical protein
MKLHVETLYALSGQRIALQDAIAQKKVSFEGSAQAIADFTNLLGG